MYYTSYLIQIKYILTYVIIIYHSIMYYGDV